MFDPRIFDYFPERPFVDWAKDVFPALLENDVPFYIHEIHEYWNDVGSLAELRQGTFDALRGELNLEIEGEERDPGIVVARGTALPEDTEIEGPAWIGHEVSIASGVRLMGPVVLGDGASVGARRAAAREHRASRAPRCATGSILIGAIAGHRGILASLRRLRRPASRPGPAQTTP